MRVPPEAAAEAEAEAEAEAAAEAEAGAAAAAEAAAEAGSVCVPFLRKAARARALGQVGGLFALSAGINVADVRLAAAGFASAGADRSP